VQAANDTAMTDVYGKLRETMNIGICRKLTGDALAAYVHHDGKGGVFEGNATYEVTFELALEYLKTVKPRALYIGLGETDDWAHERRYDRTLETAHYFDQCLRRIWEAVQADPAYRGKTTLLITVDHGRGSTPEDWNSHGAKVDGAEYIWIAALGPDTPAQGLVKTREARTQSDIAPTMLELMGLDYRLLEAVEGKPLPEVTGK